MQELARVVEKVVELYRNSVLSERTRTVALPGRKCEPQILYTLLGYEVKAGRTRIDCPDLPTARYLKIFAALGLSSVRIPYDPTRTAGLLPELEALFENLRHKSASAGKGMARGTRERRIFAHLRRRLREEEERTTARHH